MGSQINEIQTTIAAQTQQAGTDLADIANPVSRRHLHPVVAEGLIRWPGGLPVAVD